MYLFYIIALFPVIIGLVLYIFSLRFTWLEWLIVTGLSFGLAGAFQAMSYFQLAADYETWSGQITVAKHFSPWKEYYESEVDRTEYYYTTESYSTTDAKGHSHTHHHRVQHSKQVFDHWEPETRWHSEGFHWWSSINTDYDITADQYKYIAGKFNDNHPFPGERTTSEHNSRMIEGDPNDYEADNKTGWIQPVTKQVEFENRVRASHTVYDFVPPTEEQQKHLFPYPANADPYKSDRVLGEAAKTIDTLAWDQMNARIGASKKINLIIIGFDSSDSMLAQQQESLYFRGKKNDLVLCYGNGWTRVFGWTEHAEVMRKLETILLDHKVDDNIIPLIENEVKTDYTIVPWKEKFAYLTIDPPSINFLYYFLTLIVVEGGVIYWALTNDDNKQGAERTMTKTIDGIFVK